MKVIEKIRTRFSIENKMGADEIIHMEAMLQDVFVSVSPRRDFVARLNRQLISSAPLTRQPSVTLDDHQKRENLLLGMATVFGVVVILATGFRVALAFLGILGVLAQWINRKSADKPSRIQPAV